MRDLHCQRYNTFNYALIYVRSKGCMVKLISEKNIEIIKMITVNRYKVKQKPLVITIY
jgi:hypothetical protein